MTTNAKKLYRITGHVIDARTRAGIAGLRVEGWDKDLVVNDLVGSAVTDVAGAFQIEFDETHFAELFLDRQPDLFFKVFRDDKLLKSTEDSVLWNIAAESTDITIEVDVAQAPLDARPYTVVGAVTSPDRAGVGGLRIQIVDKNVGQDVQLAETSTDERGNYQVRFSATSLGKRRKTQPDLQARVYAGQTFLTASDVHYNATIYETLNVRLPANAAALPSEYATLTSALAAHYNGRLGDLQESDDHQDITFLANKTGWDARAVALAALADQFSARTANAKDGSGIEPAFFYALFRAGLPANEDTLYHVEAGMLTSVWNKAAEQGVIPQALTKTIPTVVERFQKLSAEKMLTGPAMAGVSSMKEMLAASRLDDAQQQRFAELYAAHRTDTPALWKAVGATFGPDIAKRLQLDGKLGFLTINNAPLMLAAHKAAGEQGISDPVQLAQAGYYRADAWRRLLTPEVPVPKEILGDTPEARRANYAEYLAAQIRLSYPTTAVAQMVQSRDLPVDTPEPVHAFLTEHQGRFEIGVQPVQQYLARNNLIVADETVRQLKKLQRVYQITPDDQAMISLMKSGMDSAYHIVRYDREAFVQAFASDLGGTETTLQIYDKSVQVHNAVLNIALSYLTARNGIELGAQPLKVVLPGSSHEGQVLRPAPTGPSADNAGDVIAYPTLEGLFGEMDFCACDHCRSILSPAAYLVDLLLFIDQPIHPAQTDNPQTVLLERRPDVQHLPLTCENTNTALPYIDVVNETLEYFIANSVQSLSLNGYVGHDTNGAASEDLLASPQFVMDSAYTTLRGERFPAPLPFHQPLEIVRRYFAKFDLPLPLAMERLRQNDDLERGANRYGWRDIWMETLGLSRAEYEILTDSGAVPLWRMYGFPNGTADPAVIAGLPNFPGLSNTKQFTRRFGITYDDLAAILKTRFVNPNSELVPKLERLGVSFGALKALKDGTLTDAAFDALLPTGAAALDPVSYGGDIKAWVKDNANYARIMGLITLTDPTGSADPCSFDTLEFRSARPMANGADTSTRLGTIEFVRLRRFILLWQKTGWTIEQTDAAICALFPPPIPPLIFADTINTVAKLDAGFLALLPHLGVVVRAMNSLGLTPKQDLLPLLACWSEISLHGESALYQEMFLNPALLAQDMVFADNGYGEFLVDNTKKISDHTEAVRSAFNLTADEYTQIIAALGYNANTALTVPNLSAIFRRGYLARKLRLSVRELLLLTTLTGLNPFAGPDPTQPAILRLIALVQALKDRSLKSAAALYLIWNQDLSGKSAPDPAQVTELARILRGDFASIEDQFAAIEDPGGDVARARMTLVYGQEAADAFFALLDDTLVLDVAYSHPAATLEAALTAVDSKLAYDNFRHRLSHTGVLSGATQNALKLVLGVTPAFQQAVDGLFARSEAAKGSFFTRYQELWPLYQIYILSVDPPAAKRSALLAAFKPELSKRRKRQQTLQRLSAAVAVEPIVAQILLDPIAPPYPLHATNHINQPALNDVLALETAGLATQFFNGDTVAGPVGLSVSASANLDYTATGDNPLPPNPTLGNAISGIWRGQLETPEAGFYNFAIETDSTATVSLILGGLARPLIQNGNIWRNNDALELKAGTLYEIVLTVEKLTDGLSIKWETPKRAREVIPARYLYPPGILAPFTETYIRFLKSASLAVGLGLTANEIAHFAIQTDYQIAGDGWLNALAVQGDPPAPIAAALLRPFQDLLDFARIKAEASPGDEGLLTILADPVTATTDVDSLLYTLTRWDVASLTELLGHFGSNIAGLAHLEMFRRAYDAFTSIQKMGVSVSALIQATTNDPQGNTVRDLQAALRARYATADWRDVIQPINDEMRGLQRDALVVYILRQMGANRATAQIDTADKLFEYFLMDVQMEPCMQTSRVRHALSSVQLFIERCLMNLEPRVAPSSINAKQWEWMKRYRVWEANRKVFLFPENWLEPELRDDKSPFFKEIESELLQSDITEESAAIALLNYLSKLEEVAKLEPCGLHHIPADSAHRIGEIDHVVARTSGAHRKYYYRRKEGGSWTPWEQIKLDIEDNPVLPVVWNGRLFLFWIRILTQAPLTAPSVPPAGTHLQDLDAATLINSNIPRVTVQAILCWSEYFNGKWQPTRTSDIASPLGLGQFEPNAFDRSKLKLSVLFWTRGAARIIVSNEIGYGASFFLYNVYSAPELREIKKEAHFPPKRILETAASSLKVTYTDSNVSHSILDNSLSDRTVDPHHPLEGDPWEAPFFYEDSRHVFYVTTVERLVRIPLWDHFGVQVQPPPSKTVIPPLVLEPARPVPDPIGPISRQPGFGVVDPSPIEHYVTEDAYIHRGIGSLGTVQFGDKEIGPAGSQVKSIRMQ